ncbi:MAG: class I SAM-dependent methyltransferase [Planctomycetaceae bacterium]
MSDLSYLKCNAAAWDRLARTGSQFARVATDEECRRPLETLDGRGWLPESVAGRNVLCLAAGGGWQSVLYAAAGANVTVVDLSPSMLQRDEREAARRGLSLRLIEGSMTDLSMLPENSFDIVHQPVSTCYVKDVARVFQEAARVTRLGGLYISQHKQPTSLQITHRTPENEYVIGVEYDCETALPRVDDTAYREAGTVEFLHRWEQLVGEMCRAGFVIEDLREPDRGDPAAKPGDYRHRGRFVSPFVRLKARRVPPSESDSRNSGLWVP